jgi:two-component system nitrate/nitrite response regulator NarL
MGRIPNWVKISDDYRYYCIYVVFPFNQYSLMAASPALKPKGTDQKVRVLLVDDHDGIRKVVRSLLETHPRFEIIGEAVDGSEAIEEATKLKPDVVVLNVSMPVLNGIEAARVIKSESPQSAIVILSSHADKHLVEIAKEIGAKAYVAKTRIGAALIKAIEEAIAGGDFVLVE